MDLLNFKYQKVYIQCTWANAFVNTDWKRGECIVSYDRNWIRKYFAMRNSDKIKVENKTLTFDSDCIGFLTGKYVQLENGQIWIEVFLNYCNRRSTGWMRLSDIWFDGKDSTKNENDVDIPVKKDSTKSTFSFISIALGIMSFLKK